MITIAGDPNPDVFADLDGVRVGKARRRSYGERSLQILFEDKSINWTIAAYPTERWADEGLRRARCRPALGERRAGRAPRRDRSRRRLA